MPLLAARCVTRDRPGRVLHARAQAHRRGARALRGGGLRVDADPEVAWWESYADPVLTDLIRRAARENRDVKIAAERVRAARAGATISRSWLFPSISAVGTALHADTGYDAVKRQVVPDADIWSAGGRRVLGNRPVGPPARGRRRRPRPTRWPSSTARAACACWC
jgi:outer membrane protein TolC